MTAKSSIAAKVGMIALAAAISVPSYADKRPDLNGLWTNISMTGLTRPKGIDKLELTEEEAKEVVRNMGVAGLAASERRDPNAPTDPNAPPPEAGAVDFGVRGYDSFWIDPGEMLAKVKDGYRTSYIVDPANGQIPWREGKQPKRDSRYVTGIGGNEGPEDTPLTERCLVSFGNTSGPGMLSVLYNNNYQFLQTEDHFMILTEMIHDVRIVPIFDSEEEARANHGPKELNKWFGDIVGWYEDGALYMETINVRPEQMEESAIRISENGRIIERLERWDDEQIFYQFIVEDDTLYTQPWTAELAFYPSEGPIYEYACHEGNYAMENVLRGARVQEQREAEAKAKQGK